MEKKSRRKFSAEFKTKVVLETLKERSTIEQLAKKYELHPTQINNWKKEFLSNASIVFASDSDKSDDKQDQEKKIDELYAQIGKQKVQIDFLKKNL
jgi:transposase-like protein